MTIDHNRLIRRLRGEAWERDAEIARLKEIIEEIGERE